MVLFGSLFFNDCLFPNKILRDCYWVLSYPKGGFMSRIELGLIVGISEEPFVRLIVGISKGPFVRNPLKNLRELKRDEMDLV